MNEDMNVLISVRDIHKVFRLPHERITTLKSYVINLTRGTSSRYFEEQQALKGISFDVKKGEFLGIVGRNGSGKSTLLKIIAGIYQPTKGAVVTKGRLVPFIDLGVGFNSELTGRDNVYLNGAILGFSKSEMDGKYRDIVGFAELDNFMDQKLKNYSSGMQVRLAFSVAVQANADILLIDEVLAVGDADFKRKCFNYFKKLKRCKTTVVFVSHDMNAVREFCDRALLLDQHIIIEEGNSYKIADSYNQLFEARNEIASDKSLSKKSRIGNSVVVIDDVRIKQTSISDRESDFSFAVTLRAQNEYDGLVTGFSVNDPAGNPIFGTNTQIKGLRLPKLEPHNSLTIEWTFPNIFADGDHSITIAAHSSDNVTIYDKLIDAVKFTVHRKERTAYKITPPITCKLV